MLYTICINIKYCVENEYFFYFVINFIRIIYYILYNHVALFRIITKSPYFKY